jgi:hypothetical protein
MTKRDLTVKKFHEEGLAYCVPCGVNGRQWTRERARQHAMDRAHPVRYMVEHVTTYTRPNVIEDVQMIGGRPVQVLVYRGPNGEAHTAPVGTRSTPGESAAWVRSPEFDLATDGGGA